MLGVQLHNGGVWSGGGMPISPLAVRLHCSSPWGWVCCLGLCCELGHRKAARQKRGKGEPRDVLLCSVFQQCCLLAENCVDTTEGGEACCEGGSCLLQCCNMVQLYPRAQGAPFHTGPEALQTDHAFKWCPERCNDLLCSRFNWLNRTLYSHLFVEG